MAHAGLRCGAIVAWLACCAPLLGCADADRASGVGGAIGQVAAPRHGGPFEGKYQGRQFPANADGSLCRSQERGVWFEVKGGIIELRQVRHRHNRRKAGLSGTVSADGSVAMREPAGGRSVAGRIVGDRLTAATVPDPQEIQAVQAGGKVACAHRFEATRVGSPAPGGAAPPAERSPRP